LIFFIFRPSEIHVSPTLISFPSLVTPLLSMSSRRQIVSRFLSIKSR
jgi:hypothetical protein